MNSASILMNVATPAAAGAASCDADSNAAEGFSAALAALQQEPAVQQAAKGAPDAQAEEAKAPESEDVSALAVIAALLLQGSAAANDASETAAASTPADSGEDAASVTAAGTTALSVQGANDDQAATTAAAASAPAQDPSLAAAALRAATARGAGSRRDVQDSIDTAGQNGQSDTGGDAENRLVTDKLQSALTAALPGVAANAASVATAAAATAAAATAAFAGASSSVASQSVAAAVHLATTLSRENSADISNAAHAIIREPVGSPRWADEVGSRLMMMSVRGQQEGSLTLTPEHLGPLEVQINVSKDTANVWFGAQHADTRAALTDAMPRLRELLAASGLSLGQSGVSEQAPRRSAGDFATGRSGGAGAELANVAEAAPVAWRPLRSGLIDTYA
jgi:flagellar hook-length control protein FliK